MTYKYSEDAILQELREYVESTYGQHYSSESGVQSLDLIIASGHGAGFCVGSIIKYAARYGKKEGHNRKDLLKILHYGIFLLHIHDTIIAPENSQGVLDGDHEKEAKEVRELFEED